jgi:hypothetical protein
MHTSSALAVTNTAFQPLLWLAAPICVRTWVVDALEGAFIIPAQYLSPPTLFERREVVFFGASRIMILRCDFYGKLDSVSFKKFCFTRTLGLDSITYRVVRKFMLLGYNCRTGYAAVSKPRSSFTV